jgi:hypothetical protein
LVDSDGDRSEEPPIAYDVLRDCVTSLAVIVSAFLIDSLAKAAFPDGMPVVTIVILGMLEFTLLMTFITYTAKTIFTLYKEWKTIITNSSINSAIKLVLSSKFIRDTGSSYVSGVGAGLVIGT